LEGRLVKFLQRQREGVHKIEACDWSLVRYDHPSTYPDKLLLIATPFAVQYLLCSVPLQQLRASKFWSAVFTGPDVFKPKHLSIHISAGLKYMLYKNVKPSLVKSAYTDLERHIRWKIHFMTAGSTESPYDPDYDLHEVSTKTPPVAILQIENGLLAGQAYVVNHLTTVTPPKKLHDINLELCDWLH
jgi:hypothetical protein